jgi:hypothetical protein
VFLSKFYYMGSDIEVDWRLVVLSHIKNIQNLVWIYRWHKHQQINQFSGSMDMWPYYMRAWHLL